MGTSSYILTGTQGAMEHSFGSTCHGAGRALSRSKAKQEIDSKVSVSRLLGQGVPPQSVLVSREGCGPVLLDAALRGRVFALVGFSG